MLREARRHDTGRTLSGRRGGGVFRGRVVEERLVRSESFPLS